MKISCNIIQDLLPLYAQEISSKESEQLVEEHISKCAKCKQELERLKGNEPVPVFKSEELMPLKMMKKNIKARKRRAVMLGAMISFLIMFTIFSYLTKPIYISYEESGIKIERNEKNEIYANFTGDITAYTINQTSSENGKRIVEIKAWTSIWDKILGESTPSILVASSETPVNTVYYCYCSEDTQGDNMKVVYGENPNESGGIVILPRLVLVYYFNLACILTIVVGIIWLCIRKNKMMYRICKYLFFVPASYIMSVFVLQNTPVTFSAGHDFIMNLIGATAIYGICILGLDSYKQYKEDKSNIVTNS
ncbi:MAG: zf-HC2 domain-containing protein [Cellulosilyticum sp.]|nr:zf-HC2 domain-containing protein [Cellulosilyticum sp.]